MVKKGPCLHCGINSTPLWRNGPAEKPILCNACGSRYKQKGHLDNYLPKNVQRYSHPRLNNSVDSTANGTASDLSVDDKLSDHEDSQTGEVNEDLLKSKIPSKKRSLVVYERGTAMERFQKQLVSLHRRSPPAPEDVLLKDNVNNVIIPENEIGLGGILLKPPPAGADATPTDEGSSSSKCPPKN